jgi:xanthine dehydrogenase YagR molybdenum-binding subunit
MTSLIGQPIDRVDGPLKVSGRATYAYEHWEAGQPLYGFILGATIGRGRIAGIDTTRAEQAPGVRMVMTWRNAPAQGTPDPSVPSMYWRAHPVLGGPEIYHYGQPVALVVAGTFEQARAAANLIHVEYSVQPGNYDFAARQDHTYTPKMVNGWMAADTSVGDFDVGFQSAAVQIDEWYTTPYHFSQPMEPNACLAVPHGEDLTVYPSAQIVDSARSAIASTLQVDPQRIHVIAPFTGGGFGSKLGIHAEAIFAALAARHLNQPVKVAATRQQIFQLIGMRPTSSQRVRLGAGRDGRLTAIGVRGTDRRHDSRLIRRRQPAHAAPADAARSSARRGRPGAG